MVPLTWLNHYYVIISIVLLSIPITTPLYTTQFIRALELLVANKCFVQQKISSFPRILKETHAHKNPTKHRQSEQT